MKFAIILLIAISFVASSASAGGRKDRQRMESWINHTKNDLLLHWGMPTRIADDGDGGEIILFAKPGYQAAAYYGNGMNTPSYTWYDCYYFYINKIGKVYSWKIDRQNVPPQSIDLRIQRY